VAIISHFFLIFSQNEEVFLQKNGKKHKEAPKTSIFVVAQKRDHTKSR